jgi:CsoR family transcriptional regulator, copper-sensing transcriptional repressor
VEHGYDKKALGRRLHRIEGQVRAIERMLDADRDAVDILTQIGAARTAIERLGFVILQDHVEHRVREALASGNARTARKKRDELLAAVERFTRVR